MANRNEPEIKEEIRKLLEENFSEDNLHDYLEQPQNKGNEYTKSCIIWAMNSLLSEDAKYLDMATIVLEYYKDDTTDTTKYDADIEEGEDIAYIVTVKAPLAYLISRIVYQFNINYYPNAFKITEQLLNDQSIYVARNAMVALEAFSACVYATKKADGVSKFDLPDEFRLSIHMLALEQIRKFKSIPRVLEYVTRPFNYLRRLNESEAQYVLNNFLYKEGGVGYEEEYILENVAPLLIYYAEFRNKLTKDKLGKKEEIFNNQFFVDLLEKTIQNGPPRLRTTILWHLWKMTDEDIQNLPITKKYFPLFFKGPFSRDTLGQMEIAVEKMLDFDFDTGVVLLKDFFEYLLSSIHKEHPEEKKISWLITMPEMLIKIVQKKPEQYGIFLNYIYQLALTGSVIIGDPGNIFEAYKYASDDKKSELEKQSKEVYEKFKNIPPRWN